MWRVDDCFIDGYVFYIARCVGQMCQPFLSGCFSSTIVFDLVVVDFDLCLWEISFSSQIIVEPLMSYWALIGSSSGHIIIYLWDAGVGRSWTVGVLVVHSFEFCSTYFLFRLHTKTSAEYLPMGLNSF